VNISEYSNSAVITTTKHKKRTFLSKSPKTKTLDFSVSTFQFCWHGLQYDDINEVSELKPMPLMFLNQPNTHTHRQTSSRREGRAESFTWYNHIRCSCCHRRSV